MVIVLLICLVLIIALLPVIIMRKVKEINLSKKREAFYSKCRNIRTGMTKSDVISILGNNYTFNSDLNGEYCRWIEKIAEIELACEISFKDDCVVTIEMK